MARKKKNNNNQTTSAAPNKEQAQKQSQEESRVIDELFGNLDEPDIATFAVNTKADLPLTEETLLILAEDNVVSLKEKETEIKIGRAHV